MDLIGLLFYFIIIIPSSIIHEYAHAWMGDRLGDPTARYAGRLTIDPRAHIDWIGTILLPLVLFISSGGRFMFAYAKPVPFNPYNLRDQKWGPAIVGVAGPLANLLLAVAAAAIIRLFPVLAMRPFLEVIVYANILLMVFNLVPIPPLDGSKVLFALLPDSANAIRDTLERYGMILLFVFVFFLFDIIRPVIDALFGVLVR